MLEAFLILSPLRYLPLIQLQALHEGSLAIKIYSSAYDFFSVLGFPRERYVGILINVCSVGVFNTQDVTTFVWL